jgi:hypothetical protein
MAATLTAKLQLKPGQSLAVLNPPEGYLATLAEALADLQLSAEAEQGREAALVFVTALEHAAERSMAGAALLRPRGLLWVAYPKGGAKVATDVNRDRLWEAMMPTGWRPVRQVALDATWSALRFRPAEEVGT